MNYFNFIEEENILQRLQGYADKDINSVAMELGYRIPDARSEYLQITFESAVHSTADTITSSD